VNFGNQRLVVSNGPMGEGPVVISDLNALPEGAIDWYSGTYYASSPSTNPPGPASGSSRVQRGGSCLNAADLLRSSNRVNCTPGGPSNHYGFRFARAPL